MVHRKYQDNLPNDTDDSSTEQDNSDNENHLSPPQNLDDINMFTKPLDAPALPYGTFDEGIFLQQLSNTFHSLIQQLNKQQAFFIAFIAEHLLHQQPYRIIIQGRAGTGKTYVISIITLLLRYIYLAEYPRILPVVKTATTGAAAYLIEGATIHSTFKQPFGPISHNYWEKHPTIKNKLTDLIRRMKTWILDECWLCGAKRFNIIRNLLQHLSTPTAIYGNINILFFGNINQVEPISDHELWTEPAIYIFIYIYIYI